MQPLIISCSLNPGSRSERIARLAEAWFQQQGHRPIFLDLRRTDLPLCDGGKAYSHPEVGPLAETISRAGPILLAVPIYNYDVNAAAKNLIELTGRAWTNKVVAFLCAAGGQGSYMSVMSLANSLMLDFRCLIVPRFVYATGEHFDDDEQRIDDSITRRTHELCHFALGLAESVTPLHAAHESF